jgi:hypothetical protein
MIDMSYMLNTLGIQVDIYQDVQTDDYVIDIDNITLIKLRELGFKPKTIDIKNVHKPYNK